MTDNTKEILFSNQIQKSNDLTIDDLNKYLPAVRKINDLKFENHKYEYTQIVVLVRFVLRCF